MKTVGILGGLGPQATMAFVERLHQVAQRIIPQQANSGYPPLHVVYFREPPIVLDNQGEPLKPYQVAPRLLDSAAAVGEHADFIVITANGPHAFQTEIQAAAGKPLLSMVDLTLHEIQRRKMQRVGVLGLGPPSVYTERLEALGIGFATIDRKLQQRLDRAIMACMEGQEDASGQQAAHAAIQTLRDAQVEAIILGCTEIPLLLKGLAEADDLINPGDRLAAACVQYAIADVEDVVRPPGLRE